MARRVWQCRSWWLKDKLKGRREKVTEACAGQKPKGQGTQMVSNQIKRSRGKENYLGAESQEHLSLYTVEETPRIAWPACARGSFCPPWHGCPVASQATTLAAIAWFPRMELMMLRNDRDSWIITETFCLGCSSKAAIHHSSLMSVTTCS